MTGPNQGIQVFRWVVGEVIMPHADEIGAICARGDVAVIVFEPSDDAGTFARTLGWNGESPVFRMSNARKRAVADGSDAVTSAWLKRTSRTELSKVFAIIHAGTLLVNFTKDKGWFLEPGSTDSDRV
jgi:hypothetical protein